MAKIEIVPALSWDIKEQKIFTEGNSGLVGVDKYKCIVRDDNEKVISVAKTSYCPMRNSEFTDSVNKISEITGFPVVGYSDFSGSKKVVAYLKNTKEDLNVGGHKMQDFLMLGNSHDQSSSFFLGTVTELLRCTNQFSRVKITKGNKVRHTKNFEENMKEFYKYVESYFIERQKMYNNFNKFGEKIVSDEMREDLIKVLFKLEDGKEISTRKSAQIEVFNVVMEKEMRALGNNLWGLFNSCTFLTTHHLEIREEVFGNFTGRKGEMNEAAYQFCLDRMDK